MCSGVDYAATIYGLKNDQITEANPLANFLMDWFGEAEGLLVNKAALYALIICVAKYCNDYCNDKSLRKQKINGTHILYVASAATIGGFALGLEISYLAHQTGLF